MSAAVARSIQNLAASLDLLERSATTCDAACEQASRSSSPPPTITAIAMEISLDAGMVDIEAAINIMDRLAAQVRVRARHIDRLTTAVVASSVGVESTS